MDEATRAAHQAEVDRNLAAFLALQPQLAEKHRGEHALLKDGEVRGFFESVLAAQIAGEEMFHNEPFSVQEVCAQEQDLGFFSHAINLWSA
jgi:hypothetical protein